MNLSEAKAALALVLEIAPGLRRKGVTSVQLDGLSFTLAPDEPEPVPAQPTADERKAEEAERIREQQRGKGVNDADLYADGQVPTRKRERT